MNKAIITIICFGTLTLFIPEAMSQKSAEEKILNDILKDYDKRIRPINRGNVSEPVNVEVNMFVRALESIDVFKMEYSVQLTFRQVWKDTRLQFNAPGYIDFVTLTDIEAIWTPDTFFTNERQSHLHKLIVDNNYARISPNGDVLYSTRLSLTLSCNMNFKAFPFDSQICPIKLASYGYTSRDIQYVWKKIEPVQLQSLLAFESITIDSTVSTDVCDSVTNTGVYSCLLAEFQLIRAFDHYLRHIYIPCCMMVILSWTVFWLDRKAMTSRIVVGVASLLVLATQVAAFNSKLPPVPTTSALDIWTGISLTFAFFAILETHTVYYLSRKAEEMSHGTDSLGKTNHGRSTSNLGVEIPLNNITSENINGAEEGVTVAVPQKDSSLKGRAKDYLAQLTSKPKTFDIISRVLFPSAYAIFIIIYWISYC